MVVSPNGYISLELLLKLVHTFPYELTSWFKPVFLATEEAELKGSQEKNSGESISTNDWVWWHVTVIPAMHGNTSRRIAIQKAWA
jgi:hypothetical protein